MSKRDLERRIVRRRAGFGRRDTDRCFEARFKALVEENRSDLLEQRIALAATREERDRLAAENRALREIVHTMTRELYAQGIRTKLNVT